MRQLTFSLPAAILGAALAFSPAWSQSSTPPGTASKPGDASTSGTVNKDSAPPARTESPSAPSGVGSGAGSGMTGAQLEPGSNSFTERQARSRIAEAGFTNIADLTKDDQGIWRARAQKEGREVRVGLDYRGNVAIDQPK